MTWPIYIEIMITPQKKHHTTLIFVFIVKWRGKSFLKILPRIHRLLFLRVVRLSPQWVSWYDTKQFDGEVPVRLELWGMQNTPLLPSLPGPLWPGVVALDKGPIYGLNRTKLWFLEVTVFLHLNCVFMWRRSADAVFTAGGSRSIWKQPQRPWSTWARRHVRGRRRCRERSAQMK